MLGNTAENTVVDPPTHKFSGSLLGIHGLKNGPDLNASELAFIDTAIGDIDGLIEGLRSNIQVILLDSNRNGIEQISNVLTHYQDIDAIHFLGHGDRGEISLGATTLNRSTLSTFSQQLTDWGGSLSETADLLFYGCNVGTGAGLELIDDLSRLTGADVAASSDLTGAASLGGDWDLEVATGVIEADIGVDADIAFEEVLQGRAIFNANFDNGGLKGLRVITNEPHGITVVNDPAGSGNKVVKFDLRASDRIVQNAHRAELVPITQTPIQFGRTYTYRFRTFLPNSWQNDPSWEILTQWHKRPDKHLGETSGNPPAKIFSTGGQLQVRHKWSAAAVTNKGSNQVSGATSYSGGYTKGRWVQWEFIAKWSYKADGVFKAYKDGKLIAARQGPNAFNDAVAPFMKIGIYKPDWTKRKGRSNTSRREYYVDDIQIFEGGTAVIDANEPVYGSGGKRVGGGGSGPRGNGNPVGGNPGSRPTVSPGAPIPRRTPTDSFSRLLPTIGNYRDVSLPSINLLTA
ncbi:MAG: DUF4347 domain-containing protein [Cyanobacteria bacterium P01_G01_bin.4]